MAFMVCAVLAGCALVAGLLYGIAGRKSHETALTGQIFIVTTGSENVKLGGVHVLLIEKQQVADFLRERQPAIDAEIKIRQRAVEDTSAAVAAAETNLIIAQSEYATWEKKQADDSTTAQNTELSTDDKMDLMREEFEWQQKIANLKGQTPRQAMAAEIAEKKKEVDFLDAAADHAEKTSALAAAVKKAADEAIMAAVAAVTANSNLVSYLASGDYMEGLAAAPIFKKTDTDADGRFSFTYRSGKAFTLYARSQRLVAKSTEHYCWLVDAPRNSETEHIILSNGNLTPVDPDGYFEHKPQPEP